MRGIPDFNALLDPSLLAFGVLWLQVLCVKKKMARLTSFRLACSFYNKHGLATTAVGSLYNIVRFERNMRELRCRTLLVSCCP